MAYAELAGVPPEYAFYAAPAALLAYAALGSSRQLVVAVSSAIAIMSAATISELATEGSAEYIALTAALAILAGLVSIAAGALKLGRIAQFFSESVLLGFVFGLALLISIKQIPKLLGIEAEGETAVELIRDIIPALSETDPLTLLVGALGIAGMFLLEHRLPRVPAALVVLLVSIVASAVLGLEALGVHVVGDLPAGLAPPSLPGVGLEALPLLFAGALGIALVAFAEAIGPANGFARAHGGKVDPNRELIAIGAANTSAGLFSGLPDRFVALEVRCQRPCRCAHPGLARHGGGSHGPGRALPDAALRAPAGGHPGRHRHRGRHGHDEGRQDAQAVGPAASGLLARHDRPGRGAPHAHPAGALAGCPRLARGPHLAGQRTAHDVPGTCQGWPRVGRPADRAGGSRAGPAHRAP